MTKGTKASDLIPGGLFYSLEEHTCGPGIEGAMKRWLPNITITESRLSLRIRKWARRALGRLTAVMACQMMQNVTRRLEQKRINDTCHTKPILAWSIDHFTGPSVKRMFNSSSTFKVNELRVDNIPYFFFNHDYTESLKCHWQTLFKQGCHVKMA